MLRRGYQPQAQAVGKTKGRQEAHAPRGQRGTALRGVYVHIEDLKNKLGIYIHIPFCRAKCAYCGFFSLSAGEDVQRGYIERLTAELIEKSGIFRDYSADTVFFGGGTPTVLYKTAINRVLSAVRAHYNLESGAEISCEANPESLSADKAEELRGAGVTRVSVGLQSASDGLLRRVGRLHTAEDFAAAYGNLRAAGFDNIGADMMLGLPEQELSDVADTLGVLTALEIGHISAYGLSPEPNAPLFKEPSVCFPDGDKCADMYDLTYNTLTANGFNRYEVSNFARPGRESRHNMKYWTMGEYLGVGAAAHSFYGGKRYENSAKIEYFTQKAVSQTPETDRNDYIMLGLRTAHGIRKDIFAERGWRPLKAEDTEFLLRHNLIAEENGRLFIAPDKFYVMNTIIARLIY
jgi:oxygen-independent coproporphyrinogen-3 oxidase